MIFGTTIPNICFYTLLYTCRHSIYPFTFFYMYITNCIIYFGCLYPQMFIPTVKNHETRIKTFCHAIAALLFSCTVLLVPGIILLLYPCLCFQRCLNRFHLRSLTLHTFVDAFQGCYKDGTNGTRDCHYFAALQLVLCLLFPLAFYLTEEVILATFLAFVALALYILL